MMATLHEELERIEIDLNKIGAQHVKDNIASSLDRAAEIAQEAHKAFCGSWLGYHSRIYYEHLTPPPPGARFSPEWGIDLNSRETLGNWIEVDGDKLYEHLQSSVKSPSIKQMTKEGDIILDKTRELREELLSILDACLGRGEDEYLAKLKKQATATRVKTHKEALSRYQPSGQIFSRDMVAVTNGIQTPPHFLLMVRVDILRSCFEIPENLALIAKRARNHLTKRQSAKGVGAKQGNKVFLGHGGSEAWRQLKDFIEDTLGLEVT